MRVVAYTRVSTDAQADHGLGLDVQREGINAWARAHRHRVVAWLSDEGESGSNGIETRVALLDALKTLQRGEAAGLVVYKLDRLARDLVLQEQLLADVWRIGADAFSASSSESQYLVRDDPKDPSRKLIRQVLGAVAEYERAMIRLRLESGKRLKADRGGYVGGAPRFGYKADAGELVADVHEQRTLRRARELRDHGKSLRAIGEQLRREGFPPKRSSRWHPETVRQLLNSP